MVALIVQVVRRDSHLNSASLHLFDHRGAFRDQDADRGIHRRAARAGACRPDAWCVGPCSVQLDQAAGEFCRRDELCHLPDVFHVLSALPAVAHWRKLSAAQGYLCAEPVHLCRGADPLLALLTDKLDRVGMGIGVGVVFIRRRTLGLRTLPRIDEAQGLNDVRPPTHPNALPGSANF